MSNGLSQLQSLGFEFLDIWVVMTSEDSTHGAGAMVCVSLVNGLCSVN